MRTYTMIILLLMIAPETGYCLTENSKVSILTSEPGIELYTIFGHSAIRITDDSLNIDRVYNFGTFDFSSSFFYLKFLKGNLDYFLTIDDYANFLSNSQLEQRKVYEQILNLNFSERLRLFNRLESQYNSDDRYYKYDFFYDNCATRVRDAIFNAKTFPIEYDTNSYCCLTFRQLLKPYLSGNYWVNLAVNISLGKNADKIARSDDFMFLPIYIMKILQDSHVVSGKRLVNDAPDTKNTAFNFSYLSPWLIVFLIILLSLFTKLRKTIFYMFISIAGLTGLVLLTISLGSDNPAFSANLNVLWTLPSLLVLFFRNRPINDVVELFYIALLISLLLFRNRFSQDFSNTLIPWILTLIMIMVMDLTWLKKITGDKL